MRGAVLTLALLVAGAVQASVAPGQSCCQPAASDFPKAGGDFRNQNYSSLDLFGGGGQNRTADLRVMSPSL